MSTYNSNPSLNSIYTKTLLDSNSINKSLVRISHEIIERNKELESIILIGIQRRGVTLSNRLKDLIFTFSKVDIKTGALDIGFYRDDLSFINRPFIRETTILNNIDNKTVILVDDVLFTGRTIRAAMNALIDFGRPKFIQLAVLIDRGHRELPIRPDYIGKNIPTSSTESIQVKLTEIDEEETVLLQKDSYELTN
ncbi:MAG: bifunctional pyr operon transcriptional regulator/uracil phosphoribosyltransferase [Chloroflexi bacterium]|jgi:pyrimidine operon attenuation protein/uracil phosphoribosyltransferase|nr:bifunctional pyr operon transcriptional regulator/uracil phosphoribosyltransferase [Chloroflexota bacterium]|tara:strand:+ start:651 stop:1235 length:585 start_codon:yes stop_codon:yes gene_type:complete